MSVEHLPSNRPPLLVSQAADLCHLGRVQLLHLKLHLPVQASNHLMKLVQLRKLGGRRYGRTLLLSWGRHKMGTRLYIAIFSILLAERPLHAASSCDVWGVQGGA